MQALAPYAEFNEKIQQWLQIDVCESGHTILDYKKVIESVFEPDVPQVEASHGTDEEIVEHDNCPVTDA